MLPELKCKWFIQIYLIIVKLLKGKRMQLEIIEILKNCKIKNEFENILERINTIDDLEKVWKNAHEHESDENYQINTPSINGKFIDKKKYIKDGFLTKDSKSADVLFVLKEFPQAEDKSKSV
jgi:hypothetical protein